MKSGLTMSVKELERQYEIFQIKNTEILTTKNSAFNIMKLLKCTNKL